MPETPSCHRLRASAEYPKSLDKILAVVGKKTNNSAVIPTRLTKMVKPPRTVKFSLPASRIPNRVAMPLPLDITGESGSLSTRISS